MSWQDPRWGRLRGNQNGTFPFNRDSTAFALDYLASQLRGCYEGWEWWLANTGTGDYRAGDLWGCVGAWYSGDWHSGTADRYVSRVRHELARRTWLDAGWARQRPPCTAAEGCPRDASRRGQ
jgi:autotransporter family porin